MSLPSLEETAVRRVAEGQALQQGQGRSSLHSMRRYLLRGVRYS